MQITFDGSRFVAKTTFEERMIPKTAGFRWDPAIKSWWTADPKRAEALVEFADGSAVDQIATLKARAGRAIDASRSSTRSDLIIPVPDGKEYLPYQTGGIAYALNQDGTLIADEMGLGKTIQAIGVMNVELGELGDADPYRVLVICPASLRLNWRNEMRAWLTSDLDLYVIEGRGANAAFQLVELATVPRAAVIINFDILEAHRPAIDRIGWELLVVDEAHNLKNPKAARTRAVLGGEVPEKRSSPRRGPPAYSRFRR